MKPDFNTDHLKARKLLDTIAQAKMALQSMGVIRSERFTGELGEWMAEVAYNAQRAEGTSNPDWDLSVPSTNEYLQVKTHAKGSENNAKWTALKTQSVKSFNRLIIIVLTPDYYIKKWYDVPSVVVREKIIKCGSLHIIKWNDVADYELLVSELPFGERISPFCYSNFSNSL